VYVSDRQYCQVVTLVPNAAFTSLVRVQDDGKDLVLFTSDDSGSFPALGITIAPGDSVYLTNCGVDESCAIVNNANGLPAASLSNVVLAEGSPAGVTVFQIKGIPDCRYAPANFSPAQLAVCALPGVIVNPGNPPAGQMLNVTLLLPPDATAAFDHSGIAPNGLPPLLISPQYRAQSRRSYVFEALFMITDPAVRHLGTFEGRFDVPGLEGSTPGSELGCEPNPANLLAVDVGTTVSERYVSAGGTNRYVDTLTNSGVCGSYRTAASRLSLLPYNMEFSPDTFGPTVLSPGPTLVAGNDAVFARAVQKLYSELGYVLNNLACIQADQSANVAPPLTVIECNALKSDWDTGNYKLNVCLEGVFKAVGHDYGKRTFCQHFLTYGLNPFESHIPATTPTQDIANRVGELKARTVVLRNLYLTRFLPSVPNAGFCRERGTCPAP
jgi:hypothetical protein